MADLPPENLYTFSAVLQPYMPVFYVAFLVTLILTPLMRFLAHRHGIVDEPDDKRKVHTQPIAYLGGVATFLGWLAGVSVSVMLRPHNSDPTMTATVQIPPGVLLGAAVIVLFGLLDDIYGLSPKIKLVGQFFAAMFLIFPGALGIGPDNFLRNHRGTAWMIYLPLERFGLLPHLDAFSPAVGNYIHIGLVGVSVLVAIFIIISACNATNLLDGLDGLCSGVTGIMSFGYLLLAIYLATQAFRVGGDGNPSEADPVRITLSLALLGAVLGFLPFNFNPASIFMGDTGSMFLGYMCGTMMLLFGQDGIVPCFLASLVIFGLPLLDTLLAIVRRKLNGRPIFAPDSNHFHHFLIRRGFSVRKAVFLSYGVAAVFVSFALILVVFQTRIALGIYFVLFGWLVVAAFKMGMVFQPRGTAPTNTTLNATVITVGKPADFSKPADSGSAGSPVLTMVDPR